MVLASKTFDSKSEAEMWLSQNYLTTIIGSSPIDAQNYAEVGIIYGDDSQKPIVAKLITSDSVPTADLASGKAKLYGGRGLTHDGKVRLVSSVVQHLA